MINIYSILIILLFLILLLFTKVYKVIYIRKLALPLLCSTFIICLVIFSDTAVKAALRGINLWLNIVFPSLFPFFVGSELLSKSGFVRALGILLEPIMRPLFNVPGCGSFAFAMGITSGYPVGAKITSGMREQKLLSKLEAERLLAFTNNSGPLFIIGAVGVGMFNMPRLGIFFLACHILACITVGLLFRFYGRKTKFREHKSDINIFRRFKNELKSGQQKMNLGGILGEAVKDSIMLILAIGGFIIFFSVIINLLLEIGFISMVTDMTAVVLVPLGIDKEIIASLASGFFEITTGTNMASKVRNAPFIQQMVAASMIIGWAGLSVHSQVASIVYKTDISLKPYFMGKFLQGVFAGAYTYLLVKLSNRFSLGIAPAAAQTFSNGMEPLNFGWIDYFTGSIEFLLISAGVLALLSGALTLQGFLNKKYKKGRS